MKGAVIGSGPDQRVRDPRHLGGDGDTGFAFAIGAKGIGPHVAVELGPKTVFAHAHGHAGGHLEGGAETRVPVLGQIRETPELTKLQSCKVESTELEELAVVSEAAQVAGLGQDPPLVDLVSDQRPSSLDEFLLPEPTDAGRRGELKQQLEEPFGTARVVVTIDLREVERQVVSQQPMLEARLFERDLMVGFRQLLQIVQAVRDRVVLVLCQSGLQ